MKLFRGFPKIYYPTTIGENGAYQDFQLATNIMVGVRFREVLLSNTVFFYDYVVTDQDRPDIVASKYYGSADHTWIIFYTNELLDPFFSWPLTYHEFIAYLQEKYGSIETAQTTVKHYLNENGFIIDYQTWLDTPEVNRSSKTVYEWETELNESRRNIKLLDNVYLNKVLSELRDVMLEVSAG